MEKILIKPIMKKKVSGKISNNNIINKINQFNIGNIFYLVKKNKKKTSLLKINGAIKIVKPGKMFLSNFIKNNKNRNRKEIQKNESLVRAKKRFRKNVLNKNSNFVDTSTLVFKKIEKDTAIIMENHKNSLLNEKEKIKQKTCSKNEIIFKNVYTLTKTKNINNNIGFLLIIGVFIGFINGFWGGGGGMICVPTLTMLLKLPDKEAHATTILIMLPLCVASFIVYLLKGSIIWGTAGIITSGFVVGGILGALLLKKINNTALRIVFDVIIIAGGIKMLI